MRPLKRAAWAVMWIGLFAAGCSQPVSTPRCRATATWSGASAAVTQRAGSASVYVRGPLGAIDRDAPECSAESFARQAAPALGGDGSEEFRAIRVGRDLLGSTHVRLRQEAHGRPILGAQLIVHADADGHVFATNGSVVRAGLLPTRPTLDAAAAHSRVLELVGAGADVQELEPVYLASAQGGVFLTWPFRTGFVADGHRVEEQIFIDAISGRIAGRRPVVKTALNREVYDAENDIRLPGTLLIDEGGSSEDPVAQAAYDHAGTVYAFFAQPMLGIDSFDGAGATMVASVHYDSNYNNAGWSSFRQQMVYGDGDGVEFSPLAEDLDVVAHELTHAVTEHSADLIYEFEPGALNEAWSDIMAAAASGWLNGVNDETWLIGEQSRTPGVAGDALRYLDDPARKGTEFPDYYPERLTTTDPPSRWNDYGYVHYNSGIANLAFYLLSEGGSHPRHKTAHDVAGIGLERSTEIFFHALMNYLTPTSQFDDALAATHQSALDLYDEGTAQSVRMAWAAVGVGDWPPPEYRPYPFPTEVAQEWREIAGTAMDHGLDTSVTIRSPFRVRFGDRMPGYRDLHVSSNGLISFSDPDWRWFNWQLPHQEVDNAVMPFWDDFNATQGGDVYWDVVGSAPDRELVVEWRDVPHYVADGAATFQVVFFEASSDVLFNYQDVVFENPSWDHGASATIGIQSSKTDYQQYSFNAPAISDGMSLLWRMPDRITDIPHPEPVARARFGTRIATSGPDALVLAEGWFVDVPAQVYLLDAATGGHVATIADPVWSSSSDRFEAIAIDGDLILVGDDRENTADQFWSGAVYGFDRTGALAFTLEAPDPQLLDYFGNGLALDATRIAVGSAGASNIDTGEEGGVLLFDRATRTHTDTLYRPRTDFGSEFGEAIAFAGDEHLVAGAPNAPSGAVERAGEAYVFDLSTGAATVLENPTPVEWSDFGASIAATSSRVAVGAPGSFHDHGRVHVFDVATGDLAYSLQASTPEDWDEFGRSLVIHDGQLVVGAARDGYNGAIYFFDLATGDLTLKIGGTAQFADFGFGLAALDGHVLIGAPALDLDEDTDRVGHVYRLRLDNPYWEGASAPGIATADHTTVCDTLTVDGSGAATEVRLDVRGTHDWRRALEATLSHNGQTLPAWDVGTFAYGAGTFSLQQHGVPGFTGSASGDWTLCVTDTDGYGDEGVLQTWSVHN